MIWDTVFDWLVRWHDHLESASFIATLVGVPILLVSYITSLASESHRREVGTYDTLETQYVDFQKQALLYGKLDVADTGLAAPTALSDTEIAQQRTLYTLLFSLFERAFLLYHPGFLGRVFGRAFMGAMRRQQWRCWVNYIDRYLSRPSCREAWFSGGPPREDVGQDFDARFEKFMWRRLKHLKLVQG